MSTTYAVKVFEVLSAEASSVPLRIGEKPRLGDVKALDSFTTTANSIDEAKKITKARLESTQRKVRSISFGPAPADGSLQITAYVEPLPPALVRRGLK